MFKPLTQENLSAIVDLQVAQVASHLKDRRIKLSVSKAAKQWLAMMGYDPAYGARPLRRLVQVQIGNQLATMLLSGQIHDGDTVFVDHTADEDKLTLVSMPDDPLSAQDVKKIKG